MTTDLYDLLSLVADSATPPDLLGGVRARRRRVVRQRVAALATAATVVVAGATAVVTHTVPVHDQNAQFGVAAGYPHIKGPAGWPDARLAPPILVPTEGFHGQDMHLDPLPAGYAPAISAEQAYVSCTQGGVCNRNGGTVFTLADLSFAFPKPPLLHRVVWLAAVPPSDCSAGVADGGVSAPAGATVDPAATPLPPRTHRCVAVTTIDATTGQVLLNTADG
jgi:hypothetical protein